MIIVLFVYSCGSDNTVTNNNPTGCVKSCSLLSPSKDTTIQKDTIIFTWKKATCDTLINYKFQHSFDNSFPAAFTNGGMTTDTSFTLLVLHSPGNQQYWRVIAYYTSDSLVTDTFKFINN